MTANVKLAIGVPLTFHMIPSAFFESFIAMEKPAFVYISPTTPGSIAEMRNSLVRDARLAQCSHLLMLDTDQMYPPDTIPRLLAHRKPVVGARIRRRYPPFESLMFRGTVGEYTAVKTWTPGELLAVDATGTGCILYDMRVFGQIAAPWFHTYHDHNGRPVGEDFSCCAKLREAGIPLYVDTGLYVTHLTQMGLTDAFAELYERVTAQRPNPEHAATT
jgi:hypothetical protein